MSARRMLKQQDGNNAAAQGGVLYGGNGGNRVAGGEGVGKWKGEGGSGDGGTGGKYGTTPAAVKKRKFAAALLAEVGEDGEEVFVLDDSDTEDAGKECDDGRQGHNELEEPEAQDAAVACVTRGMTKDVADSAKYFAVLFYIKDGCEMEWAVSRRLFNNKKGEMVVVCLAEVAGMPDTYCLGSTQQTHRTAIEKGVPRVALEWAPGGFPNTIVLTAPMMAQVKTFEARRKASEMFAQARKSITAYDGYRDDFRTHKRIQNDLIQLEVQKRMAVMDTAEKVAATHTGTGTGTGTVTHAPTPTDTHTDTSTPPQALVLDSVGFQSSRAVLAGSSGRIMVTVPNNSEEYHKMKGSEPPGVILLPVALSHAVRDVRVPGSVAVMVADTCGTFNDDVREVLTSVFVRGLFAPRAVLSVTVNCRAMSTSAVASEMEKFVVKLARQSRAKFTTTHLYTYKAMVFLLGTVCGAASDGSDTRKKSRT